MKSAALPSTTDAHGAAPRALGPPDLEYVGEIIVESDRQQEPDPIGAEISHGKAVKQRGAPNEHRPRHMQQVFLQDDALVVVDVGIGEIDAEDAVVVGEVRPQEEGLKSVDQQLEMREVAGVAIEQAVRPARRSTDVAVAVEHQEAVVSLHGAPQPRRGLGRRNIE